MYLSPEAQKAVESANSRRKMWWPTLRRTEAKLIVRRPFRGSARDFARLMAQDLCEFRFNGQRDWWEAELSAENYARVVEQFEVALSASRAEVQLRISVGVQDWAQAQGTQGSRCP